MARRRRSKPALRQQLLVSLGKPGRPSRAHIRRFGRFRAKWRARLGSGGSLTKAEYEERVRVHALTLGKYLGELHRYAAWWVALDPKNLARLRGILGARTSATLLSGLGQVGIRDLLRLFLALDLRAEFAHYLLGKTHLSYSLGISELRPLSPPKLHDEIYSKFAEFVVLILAEYVILHNYMFVGRVRPPGVVSLDTFLRPVK